MKLNPFLRKTKVHVMEANGEKVVGVLSEDKVMKLKDFIEYMEALRELGVDVELKIIVDWTNPVEVALAEILEKHFKADLC